MLEPVSGKAGKWLNSAHIAPSYSMYLYFTIKVMIVIEIYIFMYICVLLFNCNQHICKRMKNECLSYIDIPKQKTAIAIQYIRFPSIFISPC